jgi:hypothetical protein
MVMPTQQPADVRTARDQILAGARLPEDTEQPRPYFCRHCGERAYGTAVPRGWYLLTRAAGTRYGRNQRLGLYCNARCLLAQGPRLTGIEDEMGDEFDSRPSPFRQIPTR